MSQVITTSDDSSRRILRAALQVFAEYGFTGASTREIARRAQVHQPAIAYHYKNKDQLWRAAVNHVFSDFVDAMANSLDSPIDSPDHLSNLAKAYVEFASKNPEWAIFIIHEGMQDNERTAWLSDAWLGPQIYRLYKAVTGRKFPRVGSSKAMQAISVVGVLTSLVLVFAQQVQWKRISNIDVRSEEFLNIHIKSFEQMLRGMQTL